MNRQAPFSWNAPPAGGNAPLARLLSGCIVVAAILTSLCPLYFALFWMHIYATHGQPPASVLSIGEGGLRLCAFYLVAAFVYVRVPRSHPFLQALAVVVASTTVLHAPQYWSLIGDRNLFHNLLAEPIWELYGRVALALLCIAHFLVEHREPARRASV